MSLSAKTEQAYETHLLDEKTKTLEAELATMKAILSDLCGITDCPNYEVLPCHIAKLKAKAEALDRLDAFCGKDTLWYVADMSETKEGWFITARSLKGRHEICSGPSLLEAINALPVDEEEQN